MPWNRLEGALSGLPAWNGRVAIDTTNPLFAPLFQPVDLGGRTSSEVVADLVPGARLAKAFNTLPPRVLAAGQHEGGGRRVIFLSGDDPAAKAQVSQIVERIGFAGIDLGSLVEGGKLHQFPGGPLPALNLVQLPG